MAAAEDPTADPPLSLRRLRERTQSEFELDFLARVLEHDPFYAAALRVHAHNLARRGLTARALQMDRRLVRLLPDRPIPWYNLACSYAVLGMIEPAFAALQHAVELGYDFINHMARDPDLKALRRDARFDRLMRRVATT